MRDRSEMKVQGILEIWQGETYCYCMRSLHNAWRFWTTTQTARSPLRIAHHPIEAEEEANYTRQGVDRTKSCSTLKEIAFAGKRTSTPQFTA